LPVDAPALKARLFANENPFGPSEKAKSAIVDSLKDCYLYPFASMRQLVSLIAKQEGVKEENILLGAGSSELLLAAALHYTLSAKGGRMLSADPSYTWLMEAAEGLGAGWDKVPLTQDYAHDLDAMEKRVTDKTSLVYVCNPNNPTGTVVNPGGSSPSARPCPAKSPCSWTKPTSTTPTTPPGTRWWTCVRKGQNVMVARTFSKLHAFAGLRVGYLVAQPATIKELEKYCSGGWDTSSPSMAGAMASLQDAEFRTYARAKNAESKEMLYKTLKDEGYEYVPSHTNFVLFR
jgi:histidinol-phosphate aminotransferase